MRHGQTDWNAQGLIQGRQDIPLNDVGREQALAAAGRLDGLRYSAVVSSPLARAAETARIIAAELGLTSVEFEADLVEQELGAAEGTPWAELEEAFPGGVIPGIEPHARLVERAAAALARIASIHEGGNVVVVSHGALINAITAQAARHRDQQPGPAANGSISELDVLDGRLDLALALITESS
ncbi:histidine phosphatase family protein [Agromyces sp. NPDC056965]|uniref:histidine phosphatase family protein n=1 Tax=Agromyces sp. NPDC056965 TaxID=3345983 RepID=UPI00363644D5